MTTTTKDINKAPSSGSAKRKLTVPATRRRSSIGCRTTAHACWNRFRFLAVGSSLGPSSARRRAACSADSPAKDASWSVAMSYTLTGRVDRSEGGCLEVAGVACARSGLVGEATSRLADMFVHRYSDHGRAVRTEPDAGRKVYQGHDLATPDRQLKGRGEHNYALPILINESLTAQSANIDMVSGATVTNGGYVKSLQDALGEAAI
jgi:hypothetical protein